MTKDGKRSVHFDDEDWDENNSDKTPRTASSNLYKNLMRTHAKDRDPLFYYEIINVLGVGSMGSVATVRKRDEVVGGSARKDIVEGFQRQQRQEECFHIPFFGPFFQFCVDQVGIGRKMTKSSHSTSGIKSSGSTDLSGSFRSSQRDIFTTSERSSGSEGYEQKYAMKSIHLNRIADKTFIAELKNEVEILKQLDHRNIVRPIETFDYHNQLFIVMELCSGGDLYSRDPYSEEEAARIVNSILSALSYMHGKGIIQRDLKFENILFVNESPKAEVKLIDFGLSSTFHKGKSLTDGVGTIYTMAPEVLRGSYTSQADLWSVGVIAYMLLSSQMPFYGRKRHHIVEQILKCQYDFKGRRWQKVSAQAKAFVETLLVDDPDMRATAEEAARSTWLNRRHAATVRGPTEEELETTMDAMNKFSHYRKLKKLALMVIAHKSTSEEVGILRKIFEKYDTLKNGIITFGEFTAALQKYGFSDDELERMYDGCDVDGTGEIKYIEFLAATIEARGAISEERLAEAFDRLDSDDSGFISADNLREFLGDEFPQDEIEAIIKEADLTHDNQISYAEFLALWDDTNEKTLETKRLQLQDLNFNPQSTSPQMDTDHSITKAELKTDNRTDEHTLARLNYIEGRKLSERKLSKLSTIDKESARELVMSESSEVSMIIDPIPEMITEELGYENLAVQSAA